MAQGYVIDPYLAEPDNSVLYSERLNNKRAMLFNANRTIPQARWDLIYLLTVKYIQIYLYNPAATTSSIQVNASGDDGVNILDGDTLLPLIAPFDIPAEYTQSILFEVTLDGPPFLNAIFDFFISGQDPVEFRITGVRAPVVSGQIATILNFHNWVSLYTETLEWKTDVLIATNRSEQRIALRVLPRRSYGIEFLEIDNIREILETQLSGRKTEFFVIPTWHDVQAVSTTILAGSVLINYDNPEDYDFNIEGYLILFKLDGTYDRRRIIGMDTVSIVLDAPLDYDYTIGDFIAPCRYYQIIDPVKIQKYTDTISTFKATIYSISENFRINSGLLETYKDIYLFPLMDFISFENVALDIDHKWTILDNDTNIMAEIARDSEEPMYIRSILVKCFNRNDINLLLEFLYVIKGRWKPFWVINPTTSLELTATTLVGDLILYVKKVDYVASLKDCDARSYIRILYTDGTFEYRKITDSFINPLYPDVEELTIDGELLVDTGVSNVISIQWLELVRLNSDSINVTWHTTNTLTCILNIITLPYIE